MDAHSQRAQALAEWLEQHPGVKKVTYCSLASHPDYAVAVPQQSAFGGVLSFEVDGGRDRALGAYQRGSIDVTNSQFGRP